MQMAEEKDIPPYVRFERKAVEDKEASDIAGRSISKDVDFAIVQTGPHDIKTMKIDAWWESVTRKIRNKRMPAHWLDAWKVGYEKWKLNQELPVNGTPVKQWSSISPAQRNNLISMNIVTIEQIVDLDQEKTEELNSIGRNIKKLAENYLNAAKGHGPLAMKVTNLETELDNAHVTIANLEEKVKLLSRQLDSDGRLVVKNLPDEETLNITVSDILPTEDVSDNSEAFSPQLKDLQAQFKAKYGRKPHSMMSIENLQKKLE